LRYLLIVKEVKPNDETKWLSYQWQINKHIGDTGAVKAAERAVNYNAIELRNQVLASGKPPGISFNVCNTHGIM
jgi:hypothetical protein